MDQSIGVGNQVRTVEYAALALIAFAANSVLCHLALRQATVDQATFSTIRLASDAAMLLLVTAGTLREASRWTVSVPAAGPSDLSAR